MATDKLPFLSRWSRLKREAEASNAAPAAPAAPQPAAPSAPLPPVESLTPESDYSVFMADTVEGAVRRAALKKLFADPSFNVPDVFEPFSGDWTIAEPIPPEMLKKLNQAASVLSRKEEKPAPEPRPADEPAKESRTDEHDDAGKQDS